MAHLDRAEGVPVGENHVSVRKRRRGGIIGPLPTVDRNQAMLNRLHRSRVVRSAKMRRLNELSGNFMINDGVGVGGTIMSLERHIPPVGVDGNYSDINNSMHRRTVFQSYDFGGPEYICTFCQANMWYDERVDLSMTPAIPTFNLCCKQGTITLPSFKNVPPYLDMLLDRRNGHKSNKFKKNIRLYNSMFQFTSLGAKIDEEVNVGPGPYVFRISGQNYHRMGSLLPIQGHKPRFAQLYMYDTENEVSNRISSLTNNDNDISVDRDIVEGLRSMLDENNMIVKAFRMARDIYTQTIEIPIKLRLISNRDIQNHAYAAPACSEIAGLIVGDIGISDSGRDIIVQHRQEGLMRINDLHPLFMSMQYPLLFPYGEDGFHLNIPYVDSTIKKVLGKKFVTMREYYSYIIQQRAVNCNALLRSGRLFQQFLVDAYSIVEETRLRYLRNNQTMLRSEMYKKVCDAMVSGDIRGNSIGKRIMLPASFTGGPRYMFQNYQDAIAICRYHGYPTLFITFTCNSKWNEIRQALKKVDGQRPEDRPDIVARVFRLKLKHLIDDLMNKDHFGKAVAVAYTVEFQKRGLPHVHILLWLENKNAYQSGPEIDRIISAEIPDKEVDPVGYAAVTTYLIHGPCGEANRKAPCMVDGKCKKYFPKKYQLSSIIGDDGFPIYKRRENSNVVIQQGIALDNRYVVPHNIDLVVRYDAHINVEICSRTRAVKYLFKYINKGPDRTRAILERSDSVEVDEIKTFLDCRYLSPYEACWRLFKFKIHHRQPSVQRLLIHLPQEHNIFFHDRENIEAIVERPDVGVTMFTEWMNMNASNETARTLLYSDFPTKFTWTKSTSKWTERAGRDSIGRIVYVHPTSGELYYLRLLLNIVRGPKSFEEIRTVSGIVYPTFRDACRVLGILGDDNEWLEAMLQASKWASGHSLRQLFVTIILFCQVTQHETFFEKCWKMMSEDIEHRLKQAFNTTVYKIPDADLRNYTLISLEELLNKHCTSLQEQLMPAPISMSSHLMSNRLIQEEINYDLNALRQEHLAMLSNLNSDQLEVYKVIKEAVDSNKGGMFFVYGYGGTGKTYLWNTIISGLRSTGRIVLAVASSGIASLLLPGGRTAHSRFKIPLAIDEWSTCSISKGSQLAQLIENANLIVWDEAPMVHKNCLEALSKTLNDLCSYNSDIEEHRLFGGKTVVLGGDFRQILPVIPSGSKADILNATICNSKLWNHCRLYTLTINMRLRHSNLDELEKKELSDFGNWLLEIGDGRITGSQHLDNEEGCWIKVPSDLLVQYKEDPLASIVNEIYPEFLDNFAESDYLRKRAIITPFNSTVNEVNDYLLEMIPTSEMIYYSHDSISKLSDCDHDDGVHTPEFMNSLTFPGIPNHKLKLKIGSVIMLLRNISQTNGLCNGTRLIITQLCPYIIEGKIIAGPNVGNKYFIPRIIMTIKDTKLPFIMNRKQFPVKVSYAMTINKSQGQTLELVGLYLPRPVFTHGQLYVALSRVTTRKGLRILIKNEYINSKDLTRNVVYKEIFEKITVQH